jgi:ATP-dependent Clp protease adaptor protein ClpS
MVYYMSSENDRDQQSGTTTLNKEKLQEPKRYNVLMHNDDYTTMEFVTLVLQKFFNMTYPEAQTVMLAVHLKGYGVCGTFTYEVAESKAAKVTKYARENGHPLKCTVEPE